MCQLCHITILATRDRWPTPLEHHKADIQFLVTSAHDEFTTCRSQSRSQSQDTNAIAPDSLLELVRLLSAVLESMESDRTKWWTSSEKREQRRRWDEAGAHEKLTALHKINNETISRIEAMNARLGTFVKWGLGINGGIKALQQGQKGDQIECEE